MLDDYMHQLEAIIEKDEYDLSNFAEKIQKREEQLKLSSNQFFDQPQFITTEKKSSMPDISSKKESTYSNLDNRPVWGSNTLKNKKNKIRESLKQEKIISANNIKNKVEQRKKQNLKFRKQQEEVHKKEDELKNKIIGKQDELIKIEKEKEDLSKYLLMLEKVAKGQNLGDKTGEVMTFTEKDSNKEDNKNYEAFDSQSLTINISGGSPNVIMEDEKGEKLIILSKKDLMKYLNKLYKENQALKNFQNQIFNLSKSYGDINDNLADCIAGFQELCMNTDGDKINIEDVQNKLNDLKKYLESSLETKNNEYNILMDKKDEDINLIKNEFILLEKDMKESTFDRLEEQRKILELQEKKEELERQIAELEGKENDENNGENNEE
jgi:chromosome segregation ATPase